MELHPASSHRPKKAWMMKSKMKMKIKSMLICSFDRRGIVYKEFIPPGQTVNHFFYKDVLERFRQRFIRVRTNVPDKWMLHHDNVPCHTSSLRHRIFDLKKIFPQPLYSPYLRLKGRHFGTLEHIQKSVTDLLKTISVEDFPHIYQRLKHSFYRCNFTLLITFLPHLV